MDQFLCSSKVVSSKRKLHSVTDNKTKVAKEKMKLFYRPHLDATKSRVGIFFREKRSPQLSFGEIKRHSVWLS